MHEIIQIGVINVVNTIKRIDIPSTPNLNLIKSLIQDLSSINWNSAELESKANQRNIESIKVAILENKDIEIAPKLFFCSLDKKINKELAFLLNALQGQLLHAETIEFIHPTKNKWVKFKSELPKDFKKIQSFLEKVHGWKIWLSI